MKHLIIGAGNIGKRYAAILRKFGDSVTLVDVGFKPDQYNRNHDSALICTPPQLHHDIISSLPSGMPIFCEKPLIVDPELSFSWRTLNKYTLVSANWIFCDHLPKREDFSLDLIYPSKCYFWHWDLIHFWSWFVYNYDNPNKVFGKVDHKNRLATLMMESHQHGVMSVMFINSNKKDTLLNENPIHKKPCNMHIRQLRHWRNVLKGKENSVNSFNIALDHHRRFGRLMKSGK